MTSTAERVKEIICDRLNVEESECVPEANFSKDLNADSLDVVELIMAFETEFQIAIPDYDAEKINTVAQAIDYLETRLKTAPGLN